MRRIAVVLVLVLLIAVPVPQKAQANLLWILIPLAENLLNRKATEPMDKSTSECRVTANAEWEGRTIGTQFDLSHWSVGVRKGAKLQLEAILVGKPDLTKVVAARITSNWPEFHTLEATTFQAPKPDRHGRVPRITSDSLFVSDTGCIFPVDTSGLSFRGYTLCVDLFFTNGKKQAGVFGTDRVPYHDSTRTLVQVVVMDDVQICQQVNDPETQKAIQWSFGLQPAVPQAEPLTIPLGSVGGNIIQPQPNQYASAQPAQYAPQPVPAAQQPTQMYVPQPQQTIPQYVQPQQPTRQAPVQQGMPEQVRHWLVDICHWPGDRSWTEPCKFPAPRWNQNGFTSYVLVYFGSGNSILDGEADRGEVEFTINGARAENCPIALNDTSQGAGRHGIIFQQLSVENAQIEVRFRGKCYSFTSGRFGEVVVQPLPY